MSVIKSERNELVKTYHNKWCHLLRVIKEHGNVLGMMHSRNSGFKVENREIPYSFHTKTFTLALLYTVFLCFTVRIGRKSPNVLRIALDQRTFGAKHNFGD
jgi:hypothetical protein